VKGLNKVMLIGRAGADPEMRGEGERRVASITLATSEKRKDKDTGEWKESTEWHRVSFFGKLAEIVESYVSKGSAIYCEGKLRTRSFEQDGVKKYATEILCNEMQMLDTKHAESGGGSRASSPDDRKHNGAGGRRPDNPPTRGKPGRSAPPDDGFDDDIPF
jgi:single-strand DNA-binding protein